VYDIPVGDYDGDPLTAPNQDYNNDGVIDAAADVGGVADRYGGLRITDGLVL